MQIIPFPAHYQSVYTNFDISSFSLISCKVFWCKTQGKMVQNAGQNGAKRKVKSIKIHCYGINITLSNHEKHG